MVWFSAHEHITNGYVSPPQSSSIIRKGIFLDTAPLFVLICGHYDKVNNTELIKNFDCAEIEKHGGRKYTLKDYNSLLAFLNSFDLKVMPLLITPQIFTEFIQHLWKICTTKEQFKIILNDSFNKRLHIKDVSRHINPRDFLLNKNFIDMELEIGDVSILICAKIESENQRARTILTGDKNFSIISSDKYDFNTLLFDEIRNTTLTLDEIPKELLKEI